MSASASASASASTKQKQKPNEKCYCGSSKKYKKCCMISDQKISMIGTTSPAAYSAPTAYNTTATYTTTYPTTTVTPTDNTTHPNPSNARSNSNNNYIDRSPSNINTVLNSARPSFLLVDQNLPLPCYHGSCIEDYTNPLYINAMESYLDLIISNLFTKNSQNNGNRTPSKSDPYKNPNETEYEMWFIKKYSYLFSNDTKLSKYIISFCIQKYLEKGIINVNKNKSIQNNQNNQNQNNYWCIMIYILRTGLFIKYFYNPNDQNPNTMSIRCDILSKATRDMNTDRGLINVLSRESESINNSNSNSTGTSTSTSTQQICNCMIHGKKIAKTLPKTGKCFGCRKEFIKSKLFLCKGCNLIKYCSDVCMKNDWSSHRLSCKIVRVPPSR
jgi:hypothetical protein